MTSARCGEKHPDKQATCELWPQGHAGQHWSRDRSETGIRWFSGALVLNEARVDATQRGRILLRDAGTCRLCKTTDRPLHIGHLVTLADWLSQYAHVRNLDQIIGSDDNLALMCEECSIALDRMPTSPILVVSLHMTWARINEVKKGNR